MEQSFSSIRKISGGETVEGYRRVMGKIASRLTAENIESIVYLCQSYISPGRRIASGFELVTCLEDRSILTQYDVRIIAELLWVIQRFDLLRLIPSIQNRQHFEEEVREGCHYFSPYRVFAAQLESDLSRRDFDTFVNSWKQISKHRGLDRLPTVVAIMRKMEELDLVHEDFYRNFLSILAQLENKKSWERLQMLQLGSSDVQIEKQDVRIAFDPRCLCQHGGEPKKPSISQGFIKPSTTVTPETRRAFINSSSSRENFREITPEPSSTCVNGSLIASTCPVIGKENPEPASQTSTSELSSESNQDKQSMSLPDRPCRETSDDMRVELSSVSEPSPVSAVKNLSSVEREKEVDSFTRSNEDENLYQGCENAQSEKSSRYNSTRSIQNKSDSVESKASLHSSDEAKMSGPKVSHHAKTKRENLKNGRRTVHKQTETQSRPTNAEKGPSGRVYKVSGSPRGLCILINNNQFNMFSNWEKVLQKRGMNSNQNVPVPRTDLHDRTGTNIDADAMENTMKQFDFDVCRYDDLGHEATFGLLKELGSGMVKRGLHKDLSKYDCFMLFIFSHGKNGSFYAVDGIPVRIRQVQEIFLANNCPSLANKPKVIHIQACQGVAVMPTDSQPRPRFESHMPIEPHFLLSYATLPGYKSYRWTAKGTVFIIALVKALKKYHEVDDFESILNDVGFQVDQCKEKHAPVRASTLRGKILLRLKEGCSLDGQDATAMLGAVSSPVCATADQKFEGK